MLRRKPRCGAKGERETGGGRGGVGEGPERGLESKAAEAGPGRGGARGRAGRGRRAIGPCVQEWPLRARTPPDGEPARASHR